MQHLQILIINRRQKVMYVVYKRICEIDQIAILAIWSFCFSKVFLHKGFICFLLNLLKEKRGIFLCVNSYSTAVYTKIRRFYMNVQEVMDKLAELSSEQTKKTFMNHGASGNLYGVKIGDLKKLVKYVKKDHELALALYDTGNFDAMYLAGLSINPKLLTKETLQKWVGNADWYMLAEYTVAGVAAESLYALELAREWMESEDEMTAVAGWSTYANYLSITADEKLDLEEIRALLTRAETTIHQEKNRVRYCINGFVISVGAYVIDLHDEAMKVAETIGKVNVNMGNIACKVPHAVPYIEKIASRNKIGVKRKTCIC